MNFSKSVPSWGKPWYKQGKKGTESFEKPVPDAGRKERRNCFVAQGAQWKVIHMAHSEKNAREILSLLEREGFLARAKKVYRTVSSDENYYEIMVLGSEAVEAQQLLIENNLLM